MASLEIFVQSPEKRVMKFHLIIFLSKEGYKKKKLTIQLETLGIFHTHRYLNGLIVKEASSYQEIMP